MSRSYQRGFMGALFMLAGINHFWQPQLYTAIMPDYLPAHQALVAASGYAEIGLGMLVLVPGMEHISRWSLIALLIAVFPANLHMALHAERYPRIPPILLWLRLPLQALLIAWVYQATHIDSQAGAP